MTSINSKLVIEQPSKQILLPKKMVALPIRDGYKLVQQEHILYCKAAGNYTKILFSTGGTLLISRKLKETTKSLENEWFLRIHQSYLVNMRYATKYIRKLGGQLMMIDGKQLPISKTHKEAVLNFFKFI